MKQEIDHVSRDGAEMSTHIWESFSSVEERGGRVERLGLPFPTKFQLNLPLKPATAFERATFCRQITHSILPRQALNECHGLSGTPVRLLIKSLESEILLSIVG